MRRKQPLVLGNLAIGVGGGVATLGSGGGAPSPTYDADATAWFAAVVTEGGTDPDGATKTIISDFYAGLKADGLYAMIDRMSLVAAHDAIGARVDLVTKTATLTASGAPTFTAFRGIFGDGVGADVITDFDPVVVAGNYSQNSAGLTTYLNATASDVAGLGASIGRIASVITFIRNRATGGVLQGRVQSSVTKNFGAVATRLGFRALNRTSSSLTRGYGPDGLQSGTDDTSSSFPPVSEVFRLLRLQSGSFANDRIAFWAGHGGMDATQTFNFRNRIVTMLTALGAN